MTTCGLPPKSISIFGLKCLTYHAIGKDRVWKSNATLASFAGEIQRKYRTTAISHQKEESGHNLEVSREKEG